MRITWLLDDAGSPGGLEASALAVASVLARRHDVRVLSLLAPDPTRATVGPPAGELSVSSPSTERTRSRSPASPDP